MKTKLIVTDLDRTLLRTDKTVSDFTRQVFNECKTRGVKIVFATARPKRGVTKILEQIPADAVIVHNGSGVYIGQDLLFSCGIEHKNAKNIVLRLANDFPDATLSVEIDDVLYANFEIPLMWGSAVNTDFTDLPEGKADKILIGVTSMQEMRSYEKYLTDDLYIELSDGKLGLIMNKSASKLNAVRLLAKHFKIDMKEIVSFGDDYNDVAMLKECGTGVAVENAIKEAKAVSDFVCLTNDNDGVAKWVKEFILKNQ